MSLDELLVELETKWQPQIRESALNIYLWGSRAYGTALPTSDYDILIVLKDFHDGGAYSPDDVPNYDADKYNVSFLGLKEFQFCLLEHRHDCLECVFLPTSLKWRETLPFQVVIDPDMLCRTVLAESKRRMHVSREKRRSAVESQKYEDFYKARKILEFGKIVDFGAANQIYTRVVCPAAQVQDDAAWTEFSTEFDHVLADFEELRDSVWRELKATKANNASGSILPRFSLAESFLSPAWLDPVCPPVWEVVGEAASWTGEPLVTLCWDPARSQWRGHGCDLSLAAWASLFERAVQLAAAEELDKGRRYLFAVCLSQNRFTLRRHTQDHLVLLAVSTGEGWEGPAVVDGRVLVPFAPEDLLLRAQLTEDWPGAFTLRPPVTLQPRQIEVIARSFPLLGRLVVPFLGAESQAALAAATLEHNAKVEEAVAAAAANAVVPLPELARQYRATWWLNVVLGVRRGPVEDVRVWLGLQDSLAWLRLLNKKRA